MEYSVELHKEENCNIELTVALPVYNSKKICWLALESLSNQTEIDFDWELVIYEESHEASVFPEILEKYEDLLKNKNCKRIVFVTNNKKLLLVDKWIGIGRYISETSKCFLLHAADCYSPQRRLKTTYNKIVKEGYDWYDQTKGYFYSFISNKVFLYNHKGLTNLNMALKTEYIKTLPTSTLKKGIDGYIYKHCQKVIQEQGNKLNHYYDNNLYNDSVDTHGFNNISKGREQFFVTLPHIFQDPKVQINETDLPAFVKSNINKLTLTNDVNIKYDCSILISTYNNVQYLDECFNSIIDSIGNLNVEVLVGIDNCNKTLNYIKNKEYPNYFRFFSFHNNVGPYVVFNSLSQHSNSENIMFFGSDDVMHKSMIPDFITLFEHNDCVKPHFIDFIDGQQINENSKKYLGEGVFGIKKEIFNKLNGFESWRCAADTDFIVRLMNIKPKYGYTNKISFFRRVHKGGLTKSKETGFGSELRTSYNKITFSRGSSYIIDSMITENNREIFVKTYTPKKVEEKNKVNKLLNRTNHVNESNFSPHKFGSPSKKNPKNEIKENVENTNTNKATAQKIKSTKKQSPSPSPKIGIGKDSLRI